MKPVYFLWGGRKNAVDDGKRINLYRPTIMPIAGDVCIQNHRKKWRRVVYMVYGPKLITQF